jgi:hypothetical protein
METEVNELAAIPTGSLPINAHTAVTPLGKQLYARFSSALSKADVPSFDVMPAARAVTASR